MVEYYSFLNYIAFFIIYVICLYFIKKDFSEIIGFYVLFIVHTAATIFIGKDLINMFSGESISNKPYLVTILLLGVILAGLSCNFVSIVMVLLMISKVQTKFDSDRGTPIRLPDKNRNQLNEFENNLIIMFVISVVILLVLYYGYSTINVPIKPFFDVSTWANFAPLIPGLSVLGISYLIINYSMIQVNIAGELSRLSRRQLLNKTGS
jgi:hypothetical protein